MEETLAAIGNGGARTMDGTTPHDLTALTARRPEIRAAVRPIDMRMGILPQVATAIGNAAELNVPRERS
jgi:hypothetical protein